MAKKEPVQLPEGEGDKPQAEQKVKPAQGDAKTVRPIVRVEHDGQVYEPGSDATFEVGGKQLQSLLDAKAVEIVEV